MHSDILSASQFSNLLNAFSESSFGLRVPQNQRITPVPEFIVILEFFKTDQTSVNGKVPGDGYVVLVLADKIVSVNAETAGFNNLRDISFRAVDHGRIVIIGGIFQALAGYGIYK